MIMTSLLVRTKTPCIAFIIKQAESLGLPYKIHHANNDLKKPIIYLTLLGSEPNLPSILLNSHMDVVPVFPDKWTHSPFGAEMDAEGRIYARGTQDMKCVGMQYLGAIRALKKGGVILKRTVHVIFVPDEETGMGALHGSITGMGAFIKSTDFQRLNVGFALDEGMASPSKNYVAFYAERTIWQINFKISGTAGHGSLFLKNTAGEKFHYLLNKLMEYRAVESERLERDGLHNGDVTSVNLVQINGGLQANVAPPLIEACFDIRIAIDVNLKDFRRMLEKWCDEAGGDIAWEWIQNMPSAPATKIDHTNKYWLALKTGFEACKIIVDPHVFSGGTDSQYLREIGIPAIGFSPMNNTPVLCHDHDEFLSAATYLSGIEIYKKIIEEVANVE